MIQKQPQARRDSGFVRYEIVLHPTYRVPVLYFWFSGLPSGEDPLSIDTVFRRLVPAAYKEGLRNWTYGRVGGISIDVSANAVERVNEKALGARKPRLLTTFCSITQCMGSPVSLCTHA